MKTIKYFFLALILGSLTLTGCFIDVDDDGISFGCLDADGPIVNVELDIEEFSQIELTLAARVVLTQGDEQEVVFEGKSDILDELDLNVRNNGNWVIRTDDCVRDLDDLTFYITTPNLERIAITSSGEIESTNTLFADDIEIICTGSGEVDLGLEADDTTVNITGSGDVFLEGQADEIDLTVTGSGDFEGFDFICNKADVRLTGSGDAEVTANETLRVRITGSGDVSYRGQPTIDFNSTGSGELIDAN